MNATERYVEFPGDLGEPGLQRGRPADQHVIVAIEQSCRRHEPDRLAQAAPHPVAFYRAADLLRYRETDAHRSGFGALARLQHKGPSGRS